MPPAPARTGLCCQRKPASGPGLVRATGARRDGHSLAPVYDHDLEELVALGWEQFIARQWESIFTGYRTRTGLRRICRRWSDLLEAGLGCSQDLADLLVRREIIDRADRDLEGLTDAGALVAGMAGLVADVGTDLQELAVAQPGPAASLVAAHTRLLAFLRVYAFGSEDAGEADSGPGGPG